MSYLSSNESNALNGSEKLVVSSTASNGDGGYEAIASIFSRPPMLPLIASEPTFINSTLEILDAINYANSPAVRANLMDAIRCWISHADEVLAKYSAFEREWDKIAANASQITYPLAVTSESRHLDPRRLMNELKILEIDLSFHEQFSSLPLLACARVLKQIKEAAPLLTSLDEKLAKLKEHQSDIITDIKLVETVAEYFYLHAPAKKRSPAWSDELARVDLACYPEARRQALEAELAAIAPVVNCVSPSGGGGGSGLGVGRGEGAPNRSSSALVPISNVVTMSNSVVKKEATRSRSLVSPKESILTISDVWAAEDIADMMPPLFSALRALWVCSVRFGAKNGKHKRFSSITRFAIRHVELSIHAACWDAIQRVIDDATVKNITMVKATVVCGQEAVVAVQEAFYSLKTRLAEHGPSADGFHLVYAELDDTMIFGNVEWQFRRLIQILEIIDNLKSNTKKIGSKLTDPFEVLGAEGDIMSRHHFPDHKFAIHSAALVGQEAPDPDAIILSIVNKESERQKALVERAPRYPLGLLTSHMNIVCTFSPPSVTVVGGPLSHTALDALQSKLPKCCANKIPDSKQSFVKAEMVFNKVPNPTNQHVMRLVIPEQYCETSVHVTKFVHTILTAVEAELCWSLCGTHALIDHDFGETHYYLFKKVDPTVFRKSVGGPVSKELEEARAELEALEKGEAHVNSEA